MSRLVGVIPAAGQASRLQPLAGSKEMLEIDGRPVIDHLVDHMRAAAPDEIRIVTRPEKRDVAEHARRLGASVVEGHPESIGASIALGVQSLGADEVVMIGFPDTLWDPLDGFSPLVAELDSNDAALGLFRTPDLRRSDVVVVDGNWVVTGVEVKPAHPRSDLIWGCAAVRRRALDRLAAHEEPGHLFAKLAQGGRVRGVYLSDSWLDIGTKGALARAQASA